MVESGEKRRSAAPSGQGGGQNWGAAKPRMGRAAREAINSQHHREPGYSSQHGRAAGLGTSP